MDTGTESPARAGPLPARAVLAAARPAWALVLALASIGIAIHLRTATLDPTSFAFLTLGLVCAIVAVRPPAGALDEDAPWLRGVFATAIAAQLLFFVQRAPAAYLRPDAPRWPLHAVLVSVAVASAVGLFARARWIRPMSIALCALYVAAGVWLLWASPHPHIDVDVFQRDGAAALLRGENPYRLTFPLIYADGHTYGPGLVKDGRLMFGFPYPPLALLLAVAGQLFAGDYRAAQLAALALAGLLVAEIRPGRAALAAEALLLFTPRAMGFLENGWTEPFAVLFFVGAVFLAVRRSPLAAVLLGLAWAAKQYVVLGAPLAFLLWRGSEAWKRLGVAAAVAAVVTLPLALWDFGAFFGSVVTLQFHQPFRADSLSYLAAVYRGLGVQLPVAVAFAAFAGACAFALRRGERSPRGFAGGTALAFLAFFAFNKQAFGNYYSFALGALASAMAAGGERRQVQEDDSARHSAPMALSRSAAGGPARGPRRGPRTMETA